MRADLHVHTTASDGTLTPCQTVERAWRNGVDILAIADHDSIDGLVDARITARAHGILLVNAVELSANLLGKDIHILGYFVEPCSHELAVCLSALRDARKKRACAIVEALAADGFGITIDDVTDISGTGAVGRSHIARALVEIGRVKSVKEAFEGLIGRGRPYYVAKESAPPSEVITQLRSLRAVPVVAHPGITGIEEDIPEMIQAGLLGIEAYHADHTPEQMKVYAGLAQRSGLLVTGGSDFHGPAGPNPDIGSVDVPESAVRSLLKAGGVDSP